VSTAGSTNIDGITDWRIGDWILSYGTAWTKIDNTDAVSSVNGATGIVVLTTADILDSLNKRYVSDEQRDLIGDTYKINGVLLSGLATGIIKNTTGTGIPSIATYADLPTAPRAVRSLNFGSGSFNTTLDVVDVAITGSDSVQCSIVSGSTMTAEEAVIQSLSVAAIVNPGVGYTIHCAAPLGAIGIIGILTEKVGV
jgi:hypothetical protein